MSERDRWVKVTLSPGDMTAQVIELGNWRERVQLSWHFIKLALSTLRPSIKTVTHTIIRGDKDMERHHGSDPHLDS